MDEYSDMIMKGVGLNGLYGDDGKSRITTIKVTGYDTRLPSDDIKSSLIKHFGSCGRISCVFVRNERDSSVNPDRFALIDFVGDDAKEKALKLSGSDVGGWTVVAEGGIFPGAAANNVKRIRNEGSIKMFVFGYDTKLADDDVKRALIKHFASCGEITDVFVANENSGGCGAIISIKGEGAAEKALELCGSDMEGSKVIVEASPPPAQGPSGAIYGYTWETK